MHPISDFFIVGTDTGVGKSMVSLLLMQLLFAKGYAPFYLKPFQTGCADPCAADSDAKFIYDHTPELKGEDPAQSVIYCYPEARAPYFAARKAGDEIDLAAVRKYVRKKRERYAPLVIEGAGGLLVPVNGKIMVADLAKELDCRPILVARAGLGTINHTLLSIEAMHRRQIEIHAVVFTDAGAIPVNKDLVTENIGAVEKFGGVKVVGVIGHICDCRKPPSAIYGFLEKLLD
jgi:dethiobiotin synthetase